jgi:hypothetical protein
MNTFKDRFLPVVEELKNRKGKFTATQNRDFLKSKREGDYLIKVSKNNKHDWCGNDQQYIDYTYIQPGWFALSKRSNAQWFTSKETHEFMKNKKGFCVVKRNKK